LIIIIIIFSPFFNTSIINIESTLSSKNNKFYLYNTSTDQNTIKLGIYYINKEGSVTFTIKNLINEEYEEIIYNIIKKISQTKIYDNPFENIFEILIVNNLINDN